MENETIKPSNYERFKIETKPAPHVHQIPNKFDVSAKKVRLAAMLVHEAFEYKLNKEVVLSRPCIYGVFGGRFGGFKPLKHKCVGCMRCVQEYPHIMTVKHSESYKRLGDSFWTPEAVFTIWNEASTGKIPVKGMGYKGAFGGEGFDGIWTDMSEIVRPTRDGVYGREYISTSVDIGRKPTSVDFAKIDQASRTIEIPVPIIFDKLPVGDRAARSAVGMAAEKLGTFYISRQRTAFDFGPGNLIPVVDEESVQDVLESPSSIVEYDAEKSDLFDKLASGLSRSIVIARLPLREDTGDQACKLAREGVHGLHLYADYHGQDYSKEPKHISQSLKEVHQRLVKERLRDQVTIIASGGITLAEHVPKAIICGADLVGIDTTTLVALQAEFKGETRDRADCQLKPRKIDPEWGAQRLVNLFGVWHDQLIEILSAMGMRDVRRLRGDIGRSMMDAELREQSFKGIPWATKS
ncbi:MAG TPA: glutamate synthase-related protein [Candidatus Bathyarchaeia archaeon]|nr:glutamate synthase-related protein [Candidatus Bathyarchaeia archaeon]